MGFNMNAAFPSRYVKADDLEDRDWTVIIEKIDLVELEKGKVKPVLRFKGWTQGLVLNKVNTKTITKVLGTSDSDALVGKAITLYPSETEMNGEMVPCVRVRTKPPTDKQIADATSAPMSSVGLSATLDGDGIPI